MKVGVCIFPGSVQGIAGVLISSQKVPFVWRAMFGAACIAAAICAATMAFQPRFRRSVREDYPTWEIESGFEGDVFTFARVQYNTGGFRGRGGWNNDFPDCDWNFSARLQELTSYRVDPTASLCV